MKYQMMIKILMLLLSRRKVSAAEIARMYEISERSVYRYVEELSVAGVPIEVRRGRYGGLSIADTFKLPAGYFTRDEYAAMLNALDAMASQVHDDNILSATEKLKRQRKAERRDVSVCGNIIVDGGAWCDGRRFSDKMEVCERAVNESLSLRIDYIARGGEHSKRVVDPHVLIFKSNVWYVYAFCHTKQDFRTFKIGRIRQAVFTGEHFTKKEFKREDIPLDFSRTNEGTVTIGLEIAPRVLPDVEEWLGVDAVEPRGDKLVAELALPDDGGLVNKILSFGGGVKVVFPADLAEKVKKAALAIYNGGESPA